MKNASLFLHEEMMLLALCDREGTIISGAWYHQALGGALIAELLLSERIAVEKSGKGKLVEVLSAKSFGDPVLDECLDKICNAKKRASLQTWLSRFANVKNLKHRVAEKLCERGILRADEDKVLFFFTRKIYPEADHQPEKQLTDRLHQAIFTDTMDLDPRTIVLISLANSANILKGNFDRTRLKTRKERIEKIASGDIVGQAAKEAIEAIQAAVMVACVVPTITS